jgi:hypothetical protein
MHPPTVESAGSASLGAPSKSVELTVIFDMERLLYARFYFYKAWLLLYEWMSALPLTKAKSDLRSASGGRRKARCSKGCRKHSRIAEKRTEEVKRKIGRPETH